MRLLLIEDDPKLGPQLAKLLKRQGYETDLAKTGKSGQQKAISEKFDLIILDLNLPDKDGLEVCQGVRDQKISTPILMMTSRDAIMDKITGLDHGADDYIAKPFNAGELFARIRALLRRPEVSLPPILTYDDIVLDPASRSVKRRDQPVDLMPKEYALLEYLMRNSERAIAREELLRHVWGVYSNSSSNRLEVYIRYLRDKLDRPFKAKSIVTVRGVGYKLTA